VKEQATIKDKPPDKLWNRPPPGTVKLSVDGSFHAGDHTAGMGMVMRDDQGNTIFTACRFLEQCDSPLEAEVRACIEGLELALQKSHLPIFVETDCLQLVAAIKNKYQDRSPLAFLVSELRLLASHERVSVFVKVERSQIRVSHNLANLARVDLSTAFWLGSGPDAILHILEQDRCVTPSE
jgi:ribonuclease HI